MQGLADIVESVKKKIEAGPKAWVELSDEERKGAVGKGLDEHSWDNKSLPYAGAEVPVPVPVPPTYCSIGDIQEARKILKNTSLAFPSPSEVDKVRAWNMIKLAAAIKTEYESGRPRIGAQL